jgi:hypothetical protein
MRAFLAALLLAMIIPLAATAGPLTEGPYYGQVHNGETDTYAYARTSPLEKYDPTTCKNHWPKIHIVSLSVQTAGEMQLRISGIDNQLFDNEATTVDGYAEVWIGFSYDACPEFTIEVVGLDVPAGPLNGLYRVDVQTNVS